MTLMATTPAVLRHKARFVAIVDGSKRFFGLLDRNDLLEKLAAEHAREIATQA
jgi:hypothetical protein